MSGFLRWAAGTLALAAVVHFAVIFAYPYTAMKRLTDRIEDQAGRANEAVYPPRPDHTARRVVRPSPDLLYAICVYDVSRGPVHVKAPVADSYWSVSMFAANSDNFFVVSEAPEGAEWVHVVLASPGTDVTEIDHPVVTPPTGRGIVVYRMFIDPGRRLTALDSLRRRTECGPAVR